VLKNLAYLKYEHRELEIFKDVMELYGEVLEKEIFQYTVTGTEEYYETVGEYKQERCELNAFAAKWMASGTFKLEAIQHIQDAFWVKNYSGNTRSGTVGNLVRKQLAQQCQQMIYSKSKQWKTETNSYGRACWLGEMAIKAPFYGFLHVRVVGNKRRKKRSSCDVHVARVPASTATKNAKNEIGRITHTNARSDHQESKRKINAGVPDAFPSPTYFYFNDFIEFDWLAKPPTRHESNGKQRRLVVEGSLRGFGWL
jgi:hypothetical protein